MAPKRAGKAEKDAGAGKKARTSGARASGSDGSRSKVSEGITERQLASFSEVSAEVNSGRLLPAKELAPGAAPVALEVLLPPEQPREQVVPLEHGHDGDRPAVACSLPLVSELLRELWRIRSVE